MEVCFVLHSSGCPEHISPSASLTDPLPNKSQEQTHTHTHTHTQTCPIAWTSKHFTPHEWALTQPNQTITPPPYSCKSKHRSPCVATANTSAGHTHTPTSSENVLSICRWPMYDLVRCSNRSTGVADSGYTMTHLPLRSRWHTHIHTHEWATVHMHRMGWSAGQQDGERTHWQTDGHTQVSRVHGFLRLEEEEAKPARCGC